MPIVIAITKLISCRTKVRGYRKYKCCNEQCNHTKIVAHTCKSKICSSCGKKATAIWIAKQSAILPNTEWQHITFTMPQELWNLFWFNRGLLNEISKLAADCIKTLADKIDVTPAIFTAIHTFGRDLKRNVHIHLSTTRVGLHKNHKKTKKLFFHQQTLMRMWRYRIIKLFKSRAIKLPSSLTKTFNHTHTFLDLLDTLYQKNWMIFCQKASSDLMLNVNYFGRYIKRPPIADSKLKHYDGNDVIFSYLDHKTNKFVKVSLSPAEFIAKLIYHIPDTGFRMIRYYGILANRVRSKLLPAFYKLLGQSEKGQIPLPTFASLLLDNFRHDPFKCIKCGSQMMLSYSMYRATNIATLLINHRFWVAKAFS
jgi:hypothetical protein